MLQFRTEFNIFYYPSISRFNVEVGGKSSIQDYNSRFAKTQLEGLLSNYGRNQ